jgi:nicotinamidase-related amidase
LLPDSAIRLDPDLLLSGEVQEVGPVEVVIYKPRWGAFYDTALEAHLRSQGISTVVFCGCNFPNCPRMSIYEASERDFRVVVANEALSGLYERGERELSAVGVALMSTPEILDSLRSEITAR